MEHLYGKLPDIPLLDVLLSLLVTLDEPTEISAIRKLSNQ
jgi:hypothetical protein